ncbi:hypothetical protein [Rufibacter immobilis]|uniref:hypothetical protein n=1 Tax=Rufibacter immobilis TaxID=1348778 RepID=UPI0035E8107E
MNKEKSGDFLTYKELSDAVDTEETDNKFRTAAEFLMQTVSDWPKLDLLEPKDLIEEIRNEVRSNLTFDNLEALLERLNTNDEKSTWKRESLSSLLELFDFEKKNIINKETELETIIRKLTKHYRQ